MPGNIIKINNSDKLSWYVGDSKMESLIHFLDEVGFREGDEEDDEHEIAEAEEVHKEAKEIGTIPIEEMGRIYPRFYYPESSRKLEFIPQEIEDDLEIGNNLCEYTSCGFEVL